jgi:hypothetical protein
MSTAIDIEVVNKLIAEARASGVSFSAIVNRVLSDYVQRDSQKPEHSGRVATIRPDSQANR